MPPTYTYRCEQCDHVTDGFYRLSETRPDQVPCESCGEQAQYTLAAPLVMRASYPDGTKRKGFGDLKEASKINKMIAQTDDPEARKVLKKELKKTKFSFGEN